MKNLLTAIAIIFSTSLFAQENQFGFKGGVNVSKFSNSTYPNSFQSFIVGVSYERAYKNISFQAEGLLSSKGGFRNDYDRTDDRGNVIQGSTYFNAKYFEVPILVKIHGAKTVKPFLNAGIAPSFLLSEKEEYNLTKPLNSFNLSPVAGAGIDCAAGKINMSFELRYTHGVIEQFRTFSLMAGLRF